MRYQLKPVRMDIIEKTTNSKCWRGYKKRKLPCTVGEIVNWCSNYGKQYE